MGDLIGVLVWHYDVDQANRWRDIHLAENYSSRINGLVTPTLKMVKDAPMYIHIQYRGNMWPFSSNVTVKVTYATWSGVKIWEGSYNINVTGTQWVPVGDKMPTNVNYSDFYIRIDTYESNQSTGFLYIPVKVVLNMAPVTKKYYGTMEISILSINPFVSDSDIVSAVSTQINKILYDNIKPKYDATYWIENPKVTKPNPFNYVITADIYYASPVVPAAILAAPFMKYVGIAIATAVAGAVVYYIILAVKINPYHDAIKEGAGSAQNIIANSEQVLAELEALKQDINNLKSENKITDEEYNAMIRRIDKVKVLVEDSKTEAENWYEKYSKLAEEQQNMAMQLMMSFMPIIMVFMVFSMMLSMVRGD